METQSSKTETFTSGNLPPSSLKVPSAQNGDLKDDSNDLGRGLTPLTTKRSPCFDQIDLSLQPAALPVKNKKPPAPLELKGLEPTSPSYESEPSPTLSEHSSQHYSSSLSPFTNMSLFSNLLFSKIIESHQRHKYRNGANYVACHDPEDFEKCCCQANGNGLHSRAASNKVASALSKFFRFKSTLAPCKFSNHCLDFRFRIASIVASEKIITFQSPLFHRKLLDTVMCEFEMSRIYKQSSKFTWATRNECRPVILVGALCEAKMHDSYCDPFQDLILKGPLFLQKLLDRPIPASGNIVQRVPLSCFPFLTLHTTERDQRFPVNFFRYCATFFENFLMSSKGTLLLINPGGSPFHIFRHYTTCSEKKFLIPS